MSHGSVEIPSCVQAITSGNLAVCQPLGLGVVEWIATLTPVAAIVIWVFRIMKRRARPRDIFRTFRGLRRAIKPLTDENARIFGEFGPNSGADAEGAVRFDLSVWYQARGQIGNNNQHIARLVRANIDRIPEKYRPIFLQLLSHIDAFAAHLEDPAVDYRTHRFPEGIIEIIGK